MNHSGLLRKFPRIQNKRTASQEIPRVSRHHGQSMHERGCGHQPIRVRQPFIKALPPPLLRNRIGDGQNPVSKLRNRGSQPSLKGVRLLGIFLPLQFYPIPDFPQAKNAEKQLRRVHLLPPSHYVGIRTAAFADLREDIGVQQEIRHSSGGGRFESTLGRSKETSSSTSESAERWSLKSYGAACPDARSCSAKIRRCSSSAETPCSAARSFSAFTSASGMFLTSN